MAVISSGRSRSRFLTYLAEKKSFLDVLCLCNISVATGKWMRVIVARGKYAVHLHMPRESYLLYHNLLPPDLMLCKLTLVSQTAGINCSRPNCLMTLSGRCSSTISQQISGTTHRQISDLVQVSRI